jgi:hypothetical protein
MKRQSQFRYVPRNTLPVFFFFCVYPDYRLQLLLVGSFCGFVAHKKGDGCETEQ